MPSASYSHRFFATCRTCNWLSLSFATFRLAKKRAHSHLTRPGPHHVMIGDKYANRGRPLTWEVAGETVTVASRRG